MEKLRVTSYELQGATICSRLKNETVTNCNQLKKGKNKVSCNLGQLKLPEQNGGFKWGTICPLFEAKRVLSIENEIITQE